MKGKLPRAALGHLLAAGGLILANVIYAQFAHGVSSGFMTFAFLCPLIGGVLFYMTLWLVCPTVWKRPYYRLMVNLLNSGVAVLAVGCFLKGVFQIAGTDSPLLICYWISGSAFLTAALVVLFLNLHSGGRKTEDR